MRLSEAYRLAIEKGMENDPRGMDEVRRALSDAKREFDSFPDDRKELYDRERLWNPYADSRLSFAGDDPEVERVMWGIDVSSAEVLLADRLREKGERVDAIVAHHPTGSSRIRFPEVICLQNAIYGDAGVPINAVEKLMDARTQEVLRGVLGSNYNQAADAARLLGVPLMNIHTPADNCVEEWMRKEFEENEPRYLRDITDHLMTVPEFRMAAKFNCWPKILVGRPDSRCGKVVFKMNGGTSSPKEIYSELARAGVGTLVGMHFPESHLEEAARNHINLIVSGHMPSDSLGVNLVADEWQRHGIEVVPCSGLLRYSRL